MAATVQSGAGPMAGKIARPRRLVGMERSLHRGGTGTDPRHEPVAAKTSAATSMPRKPPAIPRATSAARSPLHTGHGGSSDRDPRGPVGDAINAGIHPPVFRHTSATAADASPDPEAANEHVAHARGDQAAPLPAGLRAALEETMGGVDLSQVRLRTGERSAHAAAALGADAFAVGAEVFFGAGRFDPSSRDGQRLIAHEVAHAALGAASTTGSGVSRPGDPSEAAADRVAEAFLSGAKGADTRAASASGQVASAAGGPAIHRQQRSAPARADNARILAEVRRIALANPDLAPLIHGHILGGNQRITANGRAGVQSPDTMVLQRAVGGVNHRFFLRTRWYFPLSDDGALAAAIGNHGPAGLAEFDAGPDPHPGAVQDHHTSIELDIDRIQRLHGPGTGSPADRARAIENESIHTMMHELVHFALMVHRIQGGTPAAGGVDAGFDAMLASARSPANAAVRATVTRGIGMLLDDTQGALRDALAARGVDANAQLQAWHLFPSVGGRYATANAYIERRFEILVEELYARATAQHLAPGSRGAANSQTADDYTHALAEDVRRLGRVHSNEHRSIYAPPRGAGFVAIDAQTAPGSVFAARTTGLVAAVLALYNAIRP
jgi:Domain of unknown function (DUF4157)